MAKINVLPGQLWSAHAALHAALERIKPTEKVLIIYEDSDGDTGHFSANVSMAEGVYLMEKRKAHLFFERVDDDYV